MIELAYWKNSLQALPQMKTMEDKISECDMIGSTGAQDICEERYHGLFQHMRAGVAVYEAVDDGNDFIFKDFNLSAERISKVSRDGLIGKRLLEVFPNMDNFGLLGSLRRVFKTGLAEHLPARFYRDACREGWRDNYIYRLPNGEVVAIYEDVTVTKLIELALRESEARWRFALEGSGDGVWDWDPQTNMVFYSKQWKAMLGYEEHEIGMTVNEWEERAHPDDKAFCIASMERHTSGKAPFFEAELRMRCKDGTYKWIQTRGKVMEWTPDHKPARVLGTHTDITNRKRAEIALKESNDNFLAFFEAVDDIIAAFNTDGSIIYTNPAASQKLGYSPDELKSMNMLDLHEQNKREQAQKILEDIFKEKRGSCTFPLITRDGTPVPVETRAWVGKWSGLDCVYCISKDLTREQEALQKFDKIFYSNPCSMVLATFPEKKIIDVNEAFVSTSGFSRTEVIGKTTAEVGIFADTMVEEALTCQAMNIGSISNVEIEFRTKNGNIVHGVLSGDIIESHGEHFVIAIAQDITKLKLAEKALVESEAKFRTFADFTYDWEYWVGPDGKIKYMSPSCERITGYSVQSFVNDPDFMSSIVYPEDRSIWINHYNEAINSNAPMRVEFRIISREGDVLWVSHNCQAVFDTEGELCGRRASNRDITSRKQVEEQREKLISELEKAMAEIKTLSGFIPICASCKKIRDDKGYWQAVEVYIRDRTDAQFSHGICPDCARKLYPEYYHD